jgi:hypothetical protein
MPERPPKPEDRPSFPRYKKRKEQTGEAPRKEVPDDLAPIMAELKTQPDRSAAIIAGSLLERILESAIVARLRPLLPGQRRALFGAMGPLSTFSAKIELGFLLGLYAEPAHKNLNMIRVVRNTFAHEFDALSFDHPDILKAITDPSRPRLHRGATDVSPRHEFMFAFGLLGAILIGVAVGDIRVQSVAETHSEWIRTMGRVMDEALKQSRTMPPDQRQE